MCNEKNWDFVSPNFDLKITRAGSPLRETLFHDASGANAVLESAPWVTGGAAPMKHHTRDATVGRTCVCSSATPATASAPQPHPHSIDACIGNCNSTCRHPHTFGTCNCTGAYIHIGSGPTPAPTLTLTRALVPTLASHLWPWRSAIYSSGWDRTSAKFEREGQADLIRIMCLEDSL